VNNKMTSVSWRSILAQADFIVMSAMGRGLLALTVLIAVLNAVFIPMSGASQSDMVIMEFFLIVIYTLLASLLLTGIADEIGSGQALIHLVQPITKREYVAAWLIAGPALLGVSYVAAIAIPALVLSPRIVAKPAIYDPIVYGLGELLYISMLTLAFSLMVRNKNRAVLGAISFLFLIPVLGLLILAILSVSMGQSVSEKAIVFLVTLFHPAIPMTTNFHGIRVFSLAYSYGATILLSALLLRYSKKLEV